jgi:Zn finger protein HypA/HybF involved in hydrogenase expression
MLGIRMIIEKQAEAGDVAHKVEIYCPSCSRDVDEAELAAQKCNDCGHDLSKPKQSVTIAATSVSTIGILW